VVNPTVSKMMARHTRREQRRRALAEASNIIAVHFGDTDVDQAKALGLLGEMRSLDGSCRYCHGLAHRRAQPRCRGCGELHAEEVLARPDVWRNSPISMFREW
jgi:hypothetical protein